MLQVFYTDVAKVDRDVAYFINGCTCTLQAFIPNVSSVFFRHMLQVCLSGSMLHMFHTYVVSVFWMLRMFTIVSSVFQVFLQVFQMYVSNVSSILKRMLQVLHLNVSKVNRVLHLSPHLLLPRLVVSSPSNAASER
jgi:hypothetical protein